MPPQVLIWLVIGVPIVVWAVAVFEIADHLDEGDRKKG